MNFFPYKMGKIYANVGEVKKRISALFKEGYVFSDILREKLLFIKKNERTSTEHTAHFVVIYLRGDHFTEFDDFYLKNAYNIINIENVRKILDDNIFNILDFYVKYGMYILYPLKERPGIIAFKVKPTDKPMFYIDVRELNKISLGKEMLGEISFAQKIIEEYACTDVYDLLCETYRLRKK